MDAATATVATVVLTLTGAPAQAASLSPATISDAYSVILNPTQAKSVGIGKQRVSNFGVQNSAKGTPDAPSLCDLTGSLEVKGNHRFTRRCMEGKIHAIRFVRRRGRDLESGLLTRIDVSELRGVSGFAGALTLNVLATASGLPEGSTIASQAIPDSSVPIGTHGHVAVVFDSPASVIAGRTYAFALVPQSGGVDYGLVDPGSYVGREAIQGDPSGWVRYESPSVPDLLFTTHVDVGDEAAQPPSFASNAS